MTTNVPGRDESWFREKELEAYRDLQATEGNLIFEYWTPFQGNATGRTIEANSGTGDCVWHDMEGIVRLTTGATATGLARLLFGVDASQELLRLPAGASGDFWFLYRAKLGAMNSNSLFTFGTYGPNGTTYVRPGLNGPTVASNWSLNATTGTAVDTGIAVDTSMHEHKCYRISANSLTYYAIDGVVRASGNIYAAASPASMAIMPLAQTAAGDDTARTMDVEAICIAYKKGARL